MKTIFSNLLLVVTGSLILTSCLKDKGYTDIYEDKPAVLAFAIPGGVQTQSLKSQAAVQEFEILIGVSTIGRTGDVTVNLALDPGSVTSGFTVYPAANVSFVPTSLTFKPGVESLPVKVRVTNTNATDPCTRYMIPISITPTTTSVVAVTNQKALISIPIANPFSGPAKATGLFVHPTAGPRTFTNLDKTLATVDCKTVKTALGDLGGNGSYQLGITVNSDNTLTLFNAGDGSGAPVVQTNNATSNRYDPLTKTFDLSYYYSLASGDRVVTEKITKQ